MYLELVVSKTSVKSTDSGKIEIGIHDAPPRTSYDYLTPREAKMLAYRLLYEAELQG